MDSQGNFIIADTFNRRMRKLSPDGVVTTIVGNGRAGHKDGAGTNAEVRWISGMTIDSMVKLFPAKFFQLNKKFLG